MENCRALGFLNETVGFIRSQLEHHTRLKNENKKTYLLS